jgi:hypothetical protein
LSSKENAPAEEQLTKQREVRRAGPRMRNEEIASGKNCEGFVSCSCMLLQAQDVIYHETAHDQPSSPETMSIRQKKAVSTFQLRRDET